MKTIAFLLHNHFEQAEYEDVNNQLKDKVKVLEIDKQGRIKLTMKGLDQ